MTMCLGCGVQYTFPRTICTSRQPWLNPRHPRNFHAISNLRYHVDFFPHNTIMPATSSADNTAEVAKILADALLNPAPASHFLLLGNAQMWAILQLTNLFSAAIPATQLPTPPIAPALRAAPPPIYAPPPRVLALVFKPTPPPIRAPPPRVHIIPPKAISSRVPAIVPAYHIRPTPDVLEDHLTQYSSCRAKLSTPANESPTLIEPDNDVPVAHRYPLRNH